MLAFAKTLKTQARSERALRGPPHPRGRHVPALARARGVCPEAGGEAVRLDSRRLFPRQAGNGAGRDRLHAVGSRPPTKRRRISPPRRISPTRSPASSCRAIPTRWSPTFSSISPSARRRTARCVFAQFDRRRAGRQGQPAHARRLRSAGFRVLKAPDVPSVLLELGFLSNPDDEKRLTSDRGASAWRITWSRRSTAISPSASPSFRFRAPAVRCPGTDGKADGGRQSRSPSSTSLPDSSADAGYWLPDTRFVAIILARVASAPRGD